MAQTLLERDGVLAEVGALTRQAARGDGRMLLLRGEAGIGKSAVVRRIIDTAPSPTRALVGRCDPLSAPRPFGPVIDMIRQLGDGDLTGLGAAIRAGDLESIYSLLLETLGDRSRWIWVIEDVQWADGATLDLLRFLARRITTLPVLVIVTYRDDGLGCEHPLAAALGDLSNDSSITRISLPALSVNAVGALASGTGVNAKRLHQLTDGNPFFVSEVLASNAAGHGFDSVPRRIAEAVWGRLARLSATGRAAAEAAAVSGPRAPSLLIERLCPGAASGLSECMRAGVLLADDRVIRFRHELVRRAILDQTPGYDRRCLHEQALAALAEPPIDPDALASLVLHAEQAADVRAIVRYGPTAAARAATVGEHVEAAKLYTLLLRHAELTPEADRATWLESCAHELYLAGDVGAAAQSLRAASTLRHGLGDQLLEGDDLRRLSTMLFMLGCTDTAIEVGLNSVRLLEPLGETPHLAHSFTSLLAHRESHRRRDDIAGDIVRQVDASTEQVRTTVPEVSARIYAALDTTLGNDDGWHELESAWHDAMTAESARELGGLAGGIVCWVATAHADVQRAERYVAESVAFCRKHHFDVFEVLAAGVGTRVDVYRGNWELAAANAEDILTRPNLSTLHRIWPAIALALVRARRGQPVMSSLLDEALQDGEPGDLYRFGAVWAARAEVAWLAGDDDGARAEAERGMRTVRAHHDPWLCGHLLRWMHPPGSEPTIVACVAEPYALEVTGDWQGAAEAWTRRGSPYDAAVAQLRGDIPAVEAALLAFRQLGARAAVDRARQRLAALRGGRQHGYRADTRADPHHLTRREREILELIAVGNSDAAIAKVLFISQRTVNNHVHAILNKLGVHNRTQAATHVLKELRSKGA